MEFSVSACMYDIIFRYQKLNKGHPSESGERNSTFNGAAKYVILDEDIPLDDDIPDKNT